MYENYILDKGYFVNVIKALAAIVEEQRDYLTGLDSAIGDGDHGLNLSIGFREVTKNIDLWQEENLDTLFKKIGMALLGKVGGSAGPLYGSLFMKMGEPAAGKEAVNFIEFFNMLKVGIEAVEARGKAVIGDKTMVDALRPGLDALDKGMKENLEPVGAFKAMVEGAKAGRDATIPLIAKKGRAMRLGERAIGHVDPGAASSCIILETFYNSMPQ